MKRRNESCCGCRETKALGTKIKKGVGLFFRLYGKLYAFTDEEAQWALSLLSRNKRIKHKNSKK